MRINQNPTSCRPKVILDKFTQLMPKDFWQRLDHYRASSRRAVPTWCFAQRDIFLAAIRNSWSGADVTDKERAFLLNSQVLGTWRASQGIYRFDAAIYEAIVGMEAPRTVPADVLLRLPEWCTYIETPGLQQEGKTVYGFFATIEQDFEPSFFSGGFPVLVLLIDRESGMECAKFRLEPAVSFQEAVEQSAMSGYFFSTLQDLPMVDLGAAQTGLLAPYLNLLLYVATQASEITGVAGTPTKPRAAKTSRGPRFFPPSQPKRWEVAVRLGAALSAARAVLNAEDTGAGGVKRPHIRRAHWHGYWSGPMEGPRQFDLKWLPPIAVKVEDLSALPAVVRPVREGAQC